MKYQHNANLVYNNLHNILLFAILLFDMFNTRREIYGFNVVASKRGKFTLMKLDEEEAGMEEEAFDGVLPQNPSIFRITRTKFADDFFARLDAEKKDKKIDVESAGKRIVLTLNDLKDVSSDEE